MRLIAIPVAVILFGVSNPATAMNWEGHDDWMVDHPAAMAFGDAVPEARPVRRGPACGSKGNVDAPDNPYEQIPLKCPNQRPNDHSHEPREERRVQ